MPPKTPKNRVDINHRQPRQPLIRPFFSGGKELAPILSTGSDRSLGVLVAGRSSNHKRLPVGVKDLKFIKKKIDESLTFFFGSRYGGIYNTDGEHFML